MSSLGGRLRQLPFQRKGGKTWQHAVRAPAAPARSRWHPHRVDQRPRGLLVVPSTSCAPAPHEADPSLERTDINWLPTRPGSSTSSHRPRSSVNPHGHHPGPGSNERRPRETTSSHAGFACPRCGCSQKHPRGNARQQRSSTRSQWPVIPAEPLKNDRDKLLIASDVRAAPARWTEAQQALVDALGNDPRTMAGALAAALRRQWTHRIWRTCGGRVEAARLRRRGRLPSRQLGEGPDACAPRVRHRRPPRLLVTSLAMACHGEGVDRRRGSASALKIAPWQVDQARRELRGWSDASLAQGAFGARHGGRGRDASSGTAARHQQHLSPSAGCTGAE